MRKLRKLLTDSTGQMVELQKEAVRVTIRVRCTRAQRAAG